jgi:excisionase family DNA binding protein
MDGEYVTIAEAARVVGLSQKSIRRAIAAGRIAGWRHGTAIRVRRDDLPLLFHRIPSASDR